MDFRIISIHFIHMEVAANLILERNIHGSADTENEETDEERKINVHSHIVPSEVHRSLVPSTETYYFFFLPFKSLKTLYTVKGQDHTGYRLLKNGCSCTSTFETSLGWLYNPAL